MRKIIIGFFTLCSLLITITAPAWAEFQVGIGLQQKNASLSGAVKLDYRISEHWEVRGIYDSGEGVLAPGVIYDMDSKAAFTPYLGLEASQNVNLVAGLKYDTSKWLPSTTASFEIKGAPTDLSNTLTLAVMLNFKLPTGRTGRTGRTGQTPGSETNEQYLLAQLITAEAGDEPFDGQVAVGAVVINRTKTPLFPKTIKEIIYEPDQFKSAPKLETIKPSEAAVKAAKEALEGRDPSNGALYFYNPATSSPQGLRFFSRLKVTARIGSHVFAK